MSNVHCVGKVCSGTIKIVIFLQMRRKGFRFTLGVWKSVPRQCFRSATVRNSPQPSARSPCGRAYMRSFAEVILFGGFRRVAASFRMAGMAFRDNEGCFVTHGKIDESFFCVAGTILLRGFHKMCCILRGRRNSLDVSIGRRSTLDVVLRVFCKSHWQDCVWWR